MCEYVYAELDSSIEVILQKSQSIFLEILDARYMQEQIIYLMKMVV